MSRKKFSIDQNLKKILSSVYQNMIVQVYVFAVSASENGLTNVKEKVFNWPKSKKKFLAGCTKIWYYKSTSSQYYKNSTSIIWVRIDQYQGKSHRLTKIEEKILSGVYKNMTRPVYVFAVLLKFLFR